MSVSEQFLRICLVVFTMIIGLAGIQLIYWKLRFEISSKELLRLKAKFENSPLKKKKRQKVRLEELESFVRGSNDEYLRLLLEKAKTQFTYYLRSFRVVVVLSLLSLFILFFIKDSNL